MTAKKATEIRDEPNIQINHTSRTQNTILTGVIDGKAFYDALSMRSFEALKRNHIIYKPPDQSEYGPIVWRFYHSGRGIKA